jgi:uncharacterized repeat protein (TIGR01451 family)
MSTFTVLNTDDSGEDSLRQAILDSNASVGEFDTIAFNIPGAGVHTIQPLTALPTITDPVTIDGTTQPGSGGLPAIELDGSAATPGSDGLVITSGGSTVRGLIINRFQATNAGGSGEGGLGIILRALGGNTIAGDYIGTDPTGTITDPDGTPGNADDLGNRGIGLFVDGSPANTIGGTTAADRNLLAGNADYDSGVDSLTALHRAADIVIAGVSATGNVVSGNFIGTDVTGTQPLGEQSDTTGVTLVDAPGNIVGGTAPGAGNVVANVASGVALEGGGSSGNLIAGNFIGTDRTGSSYLGDSNGGLSGINLDGASGNTIGGTTAGARNVVTGGTTDAAIQITGDTAPATANLVEGNDINIDAAGTALLPQIPGTALVSGNGSSDNTIGGTAAGGGNVMGGSVYLQGTGDLMEGNLIGTDATGLVGLPDTAGGPRLVTINGAGNTVGGTANGARNVIVENLAIIAQAAPDTSRNLIEGNLFGTDITGTKVLGLESLVLLGTSNNTIGGTAAGAGNVIVGSFGGAGIEIGDGSAGNLTSGNLVEGNFIGTDATGTLDFHAGQGPGIIIGVSTDDQDVRDNLIGGAVAGAGNVIAHNAGGVIVEGTTLGNSILGNSIFDNDLTIQLGIDLGPNGPNPITPGAPNNSPVLTTLLTTAGTTTIAGTLDGTPNTPYLIQFFANDQGDLSGYGEGQTYLGDATVTTDAGGIASFSVPIATPDGGQVLGATSTDPAGTTSEFSATTRIVVHSADLLVAQATDGPTVMAPATDDFNLTVSNNGPDDATGVILTDTLPAGVVLQPSSGIQPTSDVGNVLTYDLGTVATGASVPIVIRFTASQPGTYTNNASVSGVEGDPNPSNNTAAPLSVTVTPASTIPASADLLVVASVTPGPVAVGQNLTYTFAATNGGPDAAQDVSLTDSIPANTTFVSFTAPDGWTATTPDPGGTGTISATAATLDSAVTATFTLVLRVDDAAPGGATIADFAAASSSTADPDGEKNSAGASTTVAIPAAPVADLEVTTVKSSRSVIVGQPLTWTTTVTNNGPAAATGVTLVVTVPAGATFFSATGGASPSDGVLTFQLADLTAGSSESVTVVVEARAVGTLTSTATASAVQADPSSTDSTATATAAILPATTPTPSPSPVPTAAPAPTLTPAIRRSDGPQVISLKRRGNDWKPTRLILKFDQPLTTASARDRKDYRIVGLHGRVIPVRWARYDAPQRTVILRTFPHLDLYRRYRLTIQGTGSLGLSNTSGQLLDGARTGQPGSNYQGFVRPRHPLGPMLASRSILSSPHPGQG